MPDGYGVALRRLVFAARNHLVLERTEGGWTHLTVTPNVKLYPPERVRLEASLDELRRAGLQVQGDAKGDVDR